VEAHSNFHTVLTSTYTKLAKWESQEQVRSWEIGDVIKDTSIVICFKGQSKKKYIIYWIMFVAAA